MSLRFEFPSGSTQLYFENDFNAFSEIVSAGSTILLTDENIFHHHKSFFSSWKTIVVPAGEQHKNFQTANRIIEQLIQFNADRNYTLVGIGGGVVTDITGFTASIYQRGIRFGFVPTSILAIADASLGGKNGIDIGVYKNMAGVFAQPSFLYYNFTLLETLPHDEWVNGFAEICKHASISDANMFHLLASHDVEYWKTNKAELVSLLKTNIHIKAEVVLKDEKEKHERKFLNFGHTFGHAIENTLNIPHGHAISVGMIKAAELSEQLLGFKQKEELKKLLQQYQLTTAVQVDKQKVLDIMWSDKKRKANTIDFVLLNEIGKPQLLALTAEELNKLL